MSAFQFMGDRISRKRYECNRQSDLFLYNNCDMDTFADRVKARRIALGLDQKALAKKANLSQTTISDIERGRNDGSKGIVALAQALQCRAEWLENGTEPMEGYLSSVMRENFAQQSNVEPALDLTGKVPLISWVQAGLFCNSPDLLHPGDAEDWIPTIRKYGPHAYALRVKGNSMVSDNPYEKSYLDGTIIIVDPERPVENRAKVVARISDTEEATFKEYHEDAGKRLLIPLNPKFDKIIMDDTMHICGVVVGSWRDE